ncbi:hypothetical protein L1987_63727 [Smallanthus sonchifolius]|uniref:Uncharacterized protein n=1 Tax=Smallanthus sonchifolius TaxID=185202 RepID=A0ACB9CEG1_9ASTR|nr:hypothetical protein L1987_63727 [Smallanthus sonchifolius]
MDGMLAEMGHFVVDSFCPKKMQINVDKHKINIKCEAIHQLLGVPCGDVTIESMGKMDFLMCFLAVMVECHGQGRCKEKILDKLTGPLAILTLLYVDSIECKGIKMDKNTNPISLWNMSRLKERQKWEIENGGFGKGKFKRLSKVIVDNDEGDIGYSDEIEVLEKVFDVLQKQKNLFDSKFERLFENHPQRQEVLELKAKYDLLMHSTDSIRSGGENEETIEVNRDNYDTKVFNKVIDAWVDVLNYEEKYRSPTLPYRLFCDTDLIHDHYYLIVFELKHTAISVIDNFSDTYPLVHLNNHENYFQKDSAYKVKEIFVKYLEHVKHAKIDELNAMKIKKVKIPWATTSNSLDCAIFVMRHMKKKYMGAKEEFNSGLSTNGPRKNKQLKILRKKYAAHILLSESNKLRDKILIEVLGK